MDNEIKGGLQPLPQDNRDFSFGAVFGLPEVSELPEEYTVAEPIEILNQYDSDLCSAYALVAVSSDQERVSLSPEYQFAKTKQLEGNANTWGADLRTACKSAVKFGSILKSKSPLSLETNGRDYVSDWNNWPLYLDDEAVEYSKRSYFAVTGSYDRFDNLRATLWANRGEERSILTGALWSQDWTRSEGGIIPKIYTKGTFGHAFKLFGWKQINGEPYLKAQLSNGTGIGDNGIFYFPRSVVNNEFNFGAFTFKDMHPQTAKFLQEATEVKKNYTFWQKIINYLTNIFR